MRGAIYELERPSQLDLGRLAEVTRWGGPDGPPHLCPPFRRLTKDRHQREAARVLRPDNSRKADGPSPGYPYCPPQPSDSKRARHAALFSRECFDLPVSQRYQTPFAARAPRPEGRSANPKDLPNRPCLRADSVPDSRSIHHRRHRLHRCCSGGPLNSTDGDRPQRANRPTSGRHEFHGHRV